MLYIGREGQMSHFQNKMYPWHMQCMKYQVGTEGDLEIKAYYAGHVLGAAMFLVRVRDQSIVYTVSEVAKHK